MLGWVRLDYVVFGWIWVCWCLNTAKKELRKKVETCLFMLRLFKLDYIVFGWFWVGWCLNTVKKWQDVETCNLLGRVRLDYRVFGWFGISFCLNTVKESRKKVETCWMVC